MCNFHPYSPYSVSKCIFSLNFSNLYKVLHLGFRSQIYDLLLQIISQILACFLNFCINFTANLDACFNHTFEGGVLA
jgi:hypothetical protein